MRDLIAAVDMCLCGTLIWIVSVPLPVAPALIGGISLIALGAVLGLYSRKHRQR